MAKIFRQTTIDKCSTVFVMAGAVGLEPTAGGFGVLMKNAFLNS